VVTERREGRGKACWVTTFAEEKFYERYLEAELRAAGVVPILEAPTNEWVEVVERRDRKGGRLVFLLHYSGEPQQVPVPEGFRDLWNDERMERVASLPPHGVRVLKPESAVRG